MPRLTKLTPALSARIALAIRVGNYLETAASLNGICEATLHNWLARGRKGRPPYVAFLVAVEKARSAAEADALKEIKGAMRENWQAAAWYLERTRPDRWGRRLTLSIELERIVQEATEDTRTLALERGQDPDAAVAELEPYLKLLTSGQRGR